MENVETKVVPTDTGYEMDDDLKEILGKRYEDISEKFTPEAQQARRNNRLRFTICISGLCVIMCNFMLWALGQGLANVGLAFLGVSACMIVVGYNIGVCVCHNKGWRGA